MLKVPRIRNRSSECVQIPGIVGVPIDAEPRRLDRMNARSSVLIPYHRPRPAQLLTALSGMGSRIRRFVSKSREGNQRHPS